MPFRRGGFAKRPINSTKNIRETSTILGAGVNTVVTAIINAVDGAVLANTSEVERSSTIKGLYLSFFAISEGGEIASEIPLVDWYVIKDTGNRMGALGFTADGFPTPGASGNHENKRYILHTEKGLTGGGNVSLAGVPMVFKGVIIIPKGMQVFRANDRLTFCARANFATKMCMQAIYKWYQ